MSNPTMCRLRSGLLAVLLAIASLVAAPAAFAQPAAEEEPQVDLGWLAGAWEVSHGGEVLAQERYWTVGEEIYGYYAEIAPGDERTWDQLIKLGVDEGFVYLQMLEISDDLTLVGEGRTFLLRDMGETWWEFHSPQTEETITYRLRSADTMMVEVFLPAEPGGIDDQTLSYSLRRMAD